MKSDKRNFRTDPDGLQLKEVAKPVHKDMERANPQRYGKGKCPSSITKFRSDHNIKSKEQ
jgi:hypothetical protein